MKNNILLLIGFILFSFLRCTTSKEYIGDLQILTLSSDVKRDLLDTVCFKSSQFIPLETNNNSLLKRITRICNDDGKLFVFDKLLGKVVVFNMEGKYLTDIHRVGNAPSEYVGLMDFCLDVNQKQILLLCDHPYKIMRFDYSGEFINETKVNNLYFNIIANSNHVYCNKSEINTTNQDEYELVCFDMDFNVIDNCLHMRKNITNTLFFQGRTLTNTLNNYYTRRFDNAIYQVNENKIEKKYVVDFKNYTMPDDLLKNSMKKGNYSPPQIS
jgi:hypothetical protein